MLAFAAFGLCFAMIIALPPARALALRAFATGVSPLRGLGAGGGSAVVPVEAASAPRVRRDRRRRAPGAEMSTRRRAADAVAGAEKRDHFKRKVALYVCYDGSAYAGLQKNEGVSTVGDVLETALFRAGAIRESNFGDLGKVGWTVSARTDKGVSAASNVVAFKAAFPRKGDESDDMAAKEIDFSTLVAAVNKELPPDVRVLGAAKPTSSFSAKDACAGRRYEYLLPCEALAGGSGELSKLATILRQYEGTHSYHNFTVGKEHRIPPPPPATRFITLCTCKEKPVVIQSDDGVQKEFARILVQGQVRSLGRCVRRAARFVSAKELSFSLQTNNPRFSLLFYTLALVSHSLSCCTRSGKWSAWRF